MRTYYTQAAHRILFGTHDSVTPSTEVRPCRTDDGRSIIMTNEEFDQFAGAPDRGNVSGSRFTELFYSLLSNHDLYYYLETGMSLGVSPTPFVLKNTLSTLLAA